MRNVDLVGVRRSSNSTLCPSVRPSSSVDCSPVIRSAHITGSVFSSGSSNATGLLDDSYFLCVSLFFAFANHVSLVRLLTKQELHDRISLRLKSRTHYFLLYKHSRGDSVCYKTAHSEFHRQAATAERDSIFGQTIRFLFAHSFISQHKVKSSILAILL